MNVQKELMAALTIDLKRNRFRIHKHTLHGLGDPRYIQFLINPEDGYIAILGSDKPLVGGTANKVSGFGYTHTVVDVGNTNRYLRSYGGFVYSNDLPCNVLAWSWTEITFQLPLAAQTGPIRVLLTEPVLLSGGDHTRLLVQEAPAGDFTATAKLTVLGPKSNYYDFGICLYNSANGRRIVFGKCCRSGYSGIQAIKFTSNTAFSSDAYLNGGWDSIFIYVRVRKAGTSYYLDLSYDGDFWWQIFTENISTFLSAISHVGVGYFRNNSSGVTYRGRCDWFRVTEP